MLAIADPMHFVARYMYQVYTTQSLSDLLFNIRCIISTILCDNNIVKLNMHNIIISIIIFVVVFGVRYIRPYSVNC